MSAARCDAPSASAGGSRKEGAADGLPGTAFAAGDHHATRQAFQALARLDASRASAAQAFCRHG